MGGICMRHIHARASLAVLLCLLTLTTFVTFPGLLAQGQVPAPGPVAGDPTPAMFPNNPAENDIDGTIALDTHTLVALPLAVALGAALALRPRRRGTPKRSTPVIQTQIILAIIGALVMIVVGTSLARAFGVVGAAGLVRYRAKIEDPKDAGVMLSTLAVGLACGIGLYGLAAFSAFFIVAVLWVIESFEPKPRNVFTLEVKTKNVATVQKKVEGLLRRHRVKYELRESSPEEFSYHVELPIELKTDGLSTEIISFDDDKGTAVEWKTEKKK
jgi:uncharacterized membrane protein YhiD involved in acid resistance